MLDAVTAPILAHDAVGAVHPNMDTARIQLNQQVTQTAHFLTLLAYQWLSVSMHQRPQKAKIALREKGVAFDLELPESFGTGRTGGPFAAANPRAEVPGVG